MKYRSRLRRLAAAIAGALLAAAGLELFLMPHGLLVGGPAGLSALLAHTTEMRLGLFLLFLNLPFIFAARRLVDLRFALGTLAVLVFLATVTLALHHAPPVVSDPVTAAVLGGLCLGVGIGVLVRFGGGTPDAERQGLAMLFGSSSRTLEYVVMAINCALLAVAGWLFGWEQAMRSIIAYLLAFEGVRFVLRDDKRRRLAVAISSRVPHLVDRRILETSETSISDRKAGADARLVLFDRTRSQGWLLYVTDSEGADLITALAASCDPDCSVTVREASRRFRGSSPQQEMD